MLASIQWLRELTGLELDIDELAEKLTNIGLEVDGIERFEAPEKVVVGQVRSKEKHPDKDRLSIVTVFDGTDEITVICGAPNVPEPGGHILFAQVGASLPLEEGGTMDIGERKIAGVVSRGMICSETELRIGSGSAGIFVFEDEPGLTAIPKPGTPLAEALPVGDVVFEIGLTPNRPDCLGHIGIARDIAAVMGRPFEPPAVKAPPKVAAGVEAVVPAVPMRAPLRFDGQGETSAVDAAGLGPFSVEIADPERCPRYGAAFVLGGQVGKSPFWLRYRLHVLGLRSRSNLVDVTNYVMLETGHPLHGFDLETLRGRKIVVRTATDGERMTTLDDEERTLSADDLLICDGEGPVAIAGVMGGEDSEIGEATRHVAIECAYFDPRSIRRTARRLGMHTDASHRFERGVDPNDVPYVLARTASLMAELGGGVALGEALDAYPAPIERRAITLRIPRLDALLGFSVPPATAQACLERLGCEVKADGDVLEVKAPTWRPDLAIEEDLIEEVVRVHGYEHVPALVPAIRPSRSGSPGPARFEREVKERVAGLGLYEAINHAFVAPGDLAKARAPEAVVKVTNPLSEERSVMRTSLLPGLATAAGHALRRQAPGACLFEVGRTIHPRDGGELPLERDTLAIFLAGVAHGPAGNAWIGGERAFDFYDLKGFVEAAIDALAGRSPALVPSDEVPSWAHPRRVGAIELAGERVGIAAELHPEVGEALGLEDHRGQYAELDLAKLREVITAAGVSRAPNLPKVPAVVRDVALLVDAEHTAGSVAAALAEGGGALVESVTLFDRYEGKGVPEGKRSLAFRLVYRDPKETLTDKVVDKAHRKAAEAAKARCGAELR